MRMTVDGSPEMIDRFLSDFKSYTGGNKKFFPVAFQLAKKDSGKNDRGFEVNGVMLTPPPSFGKKQIIDFFVDFLDAVDWAAEKEVRLRAVAI